jgi:hypothetical protein
MLVNDELAYQPLDEFVVVDDGLNLANITADQAVNECVVSNGLLTQLNTLKHFQNTVSPFYPPGTNIGANSFNYPPGTNLGTNINYGSPIDAMRTLSTQVTLDLKPVAGSEFHTDFFPSVSQLALPKTIDLAAFNAVDESEWDIGIDGAIWDNGASEWDSPTP